MVAAAPAGGARSTPTSKQRTATMDVRRAMKTSPGQADTRGQPVPGKRGEGLSRAGVRSGAGSPGQGLREAQRRSSEEAGDVVADVLELAVADGGVGADPRVDQPVRRAVGGTAGARLLQRLVDEGVRPAGDARQHLGDLGQGERL